MEVYALWERGTRPDFLYQDNPYLLGVFAKEEEAKKQAAAYNRADRWDRYYVTTIKVAQL